MGNDSANQQKERGQRGSLQEENGLGNLKMWRVMATSIGGKSVRM